MNGDKIESTPQIETPSSLDQPVEDVVIKDSTLMLLGFAMVGKQCHHAFYDGNKYQPSAVCAWGAYALAKYGDASKGHIRDEELRQKLIAHDIFVNLENVRRPIPEIAAMLAEKGL